MFFILLSCQRSGTTHSQRKESNDLQGKESEKNTKSPSKTQKTGRQTNTTNSPSVGVSVDPVCLDKMKNVF